MKTLHIAALGTIVSLSSTQDFSWGKREQCLLGAYVPGAKITTAKESHYELTHVESTKVKLLQETNGTRLWAPWEGKISFETFFLIYAVFRDLWLKKEIYTAHAATVSIDETLVLLAGNSGVGKSHLSWGMAKNTNSLLSGNVSLMEFQPAIKFLAGTEVASFKKEDLEKLGATAYIEEMHRAFVQIPIKTIQVNNNVNSNKVSKIILPKLNDAQLNITKIDSLSAFHELTPLFLDMAHADVVVGKGEGMWVSSANKSAKKLLAKRLYASLEHIDVYKASGKLQDLLRELA